MAKLPDDVAIRVTDIHKDFHLPRNNDDSIKHKIITAFEKKDKNVDVQHALNGISFDIKKGEFFGILGRNGSGKSTLLKIISDIYRPTSGHVSHQGSLVAFIELGVGFNPQLTGRENVYLNGALLGFSRKEIDAFYDEVVAFAELEDFMEQKLKNYSSGMKVRLAFSVAIRADADILILDEVLAVGDAAFQRKCYEYFKDLKERHKTIVFVSHSMGAVKEYCDRAILIEGGKIIHQGLADDIANEYLRLFVKPKDGSKQSAHRFGNDKVKIKKIQTTTSDQYITVDITLKCGDESVKDVVIAADVYNKSDHLIGGIESHNYPGGKVNLSAGEEKSIRLKFDNIFGSGEFKITVAAKTEGNMDIFDFWKFATNFTNTAKFDADDYFPIVLPMKLEVTEK